MKMFFFLLLSCSVFGQMPKWADQNLWRKSLKEGMNEASVVRILGQPLAIKKDSESMTYYYQKEPEVVTVKKGKEEKQEIKYPSIGIVFFRINLPFTVVSQRRIYSETFRRGSKPMYAVHSWEEPEWDTINPAEKDPPKKLQPKRKLNKYEIESNWERIRFGMNAQSIRVIIGEPNVAKKDTFIYELPNQTIILRFNSDILLSWEYPYWPVIIEELYEEVKKELTPATPPPENGR